MTTTPPPTNHFAADEPEDQADDLRTLIERASNAPRGKTESSLWAQAATLAEERDDLPTAVHCYLCLAGAYQTGGDYTRAIAPLAWLDKTYREHPEAFNKGQLKSLASFYATTITAMTLLPTVSASQLEHLAQRMRELYLQLGDTLRSVHLTQLEISNTLGDEEAEDRALAQWQTTPRGELSSPLASEMLTVLPYYRDRGQWTTAADMGEAALVEDQDNRFVTDPLCNELMVPWLYAGKDELAWAAHVRTYRKWQQSPYDAQYLPEHVLYLALSGQVGRPSRLERGLKIFRRHLPWLTEFETPRDLQLFAIAGYVLLGALPPQRQGEQLQGTLPGDSLEWAEADRLDNPTIEQARQWCEDLARSLAESFAARPGHPHPEVEMSRLEAQLNPELPPRLEPEADIPDVTGLSGQLVVDRSSGSPTVRTTGIFGTAAPGDHPEEEEPPAPVDVRGPWRDAPVGELIAAETAFGLDADSIFALTAKQRLIDRPEPPEQWPEFINQPETAAAAAAKEDSPAEAYIRLRLAIEAAELRGVPEEQLAPHRERLAGLGDGRPTSVEPAYTLLEPAQQHMDAGENKECAQLCHQSLYAETTEPIGARLCAWLLMGRAAQRAGYLNEAIAPLRDCVNLSAACGLPHFRMLAASSLSEVLLDLKRPAEAADLLQGCLDELTAGPPLPDMLLAARFGLARAAADLGHSEDAGRYFEQLSETAQSQNQSMQLREIALNHYQNAGLHHRAIALAQRAVDQQQVLLDQARSRWESLKEKAQTQDLPAQAPEAEELADAKKDYATQEVNLSDALNALAVLISEQPGPASTEDLARVESLLDSIRQLVVNTELEDHWTRSRQWRDALCTTRAADIWWDCHRFRTGMDYKAMSAQGFAAAGDEEGQLRALLQLAVMHIQRQDLTAAQAIVDEIAPRVAAVRFAGTPLRREFQEVKDELAQY